MTRIAATLVAAFVAVLLSAAAPARAETLLERGTYLMRGIVACGNCHTPKGPEGELPGMELAGGFLMEDAAFTSYAPNITPTNLADWSDAAIKQAIATGVRPDGSRLLPPMGVGYYATISEPDLDAIVTYLRSLPAR